MKFRYYTKSLDQNLPGYERDKQQLHQWLLLKNDRHESPDFDARDLAMIKEIVQECYDAANEL